MNRKKKLIITVVLIPIIIIAVFGLIRSSQNEVTGNTLKSEQKDPIKPTRETARVVKVIDGDTFDLDNGERVRVLGINTPETGEPYYVEAGERLKQLVEGKEVRLEMDTEDRGKYGRLLRYVFIDDIFVNTLLVEEGLATVYIPDESKYEKEFQEAEAKCTERLCKGSDTSCKIEVVEIHYDAEGNDNLNLADEYVILRNKGGDCDLTEWTLKDETNSHIFTFPAIIFGANTEITIRSGYGTNQGAEFYFNLKDAIWNNAGDTLFLKDASGAVVIKEHYEGR